MTVLNQAAQLSRSVTVLNQAAQLSRSVTVLNQAVQLSRSVAVLNQSDLYSIAACHCINDILYLYDYILSPCNTAWC